MSGVLRGVLREPLVHFVVLGGLVFAVGRASPEAPDDRVIRVTTQLRDQLRGQNRDGTPADEAQLQRRVDGWIEEELLVREARRLGLDRGDPVIRQRLVQKMEFVVQSGEPVLEASDADLEAFLGEHAERYAGAPRYDFVQIVVPVAEDPAGAQAEALLEALRGGADPESLGRRVGRSRKFTLDNVAGTFGPELAASLQTLQPGRWVLTQSDAARTIVRLDGVQQGVTPPLSRVRNRVELDWKKAQRQEVVRRGIEALRADYRIEVEP